MITNDDQAVEALKVAKSWLKELHAIDVMDGPGRYAAADATMNVRDVIRYLRRKRRKRKCQ